MIDNETAPTLKNKIRKGRLTFLAIVALFIVPFIVLPLIMSPDQMKKTNKGSLVQPHVVFAALHVADVKNLSLIKGKWTLLYFVPEKCEQICINALYSIRQVPKTLDRDMDRVQSLLVMTSDMSPELNLLLEKEFTVLPQARADKNTINAVFSSAISGIDVINASYIYLMSPDGYIFMFYPPRKDEQEAINHALDIRSDLKKSIKGSRI